MSIIKEYAPWIVLGFFFCGDSLKNNEDYLRYLFVNGLENTKNQVIYVPTEAQLPILEASRKPPQ